MGDFYVNFLIGALVELPAYIVAMIVVKWVCLNDFQLP